MIRRRKLLLALAASLLARADEVIE